MTAVAALRLSPRSPLAGPMRRVTALLLAALPPRGVSRLGAAPGDGGLEQRWRAWKRAYAPTPFPSDDDARRARTAFAANDRTILAHNARGNSSWALGHNQFSGLTPEQFASQHTLAAPPLTPPRLQPHELATNDPELPRAPPAANSSHDWSEHGVVAPVQQQGSCGGCWAFATSAAMESALAIATQQSTPSVCNRLWDCSGIGAGMVLECVVVAGLLLPVKYSGSVMIKFW
eukprot:SAG11_NODE_3641_length_2317_cov_1.812444_1_plen_232_part_00